MDLEADRARYEADRAKDIRLSATNGIDAALKANRLDALLFPGGAGAAIARAAGYPTVTVPFGMVPNAPTAARFRRASTRKPAPFSVSFTGTACSEPKLIELGLRVRAGDEEADAAGPCPMNRRRFLRIVAAAAAVSPSARAAARVSSWLAGAASLDITPERSLWMAGFARRTQPSQGVALPLRAKALALQHRDGRPVVLVTVDLLGVTARLTDRVAAELQRLHGVRRAEILFNASHTHCGPVVDEQLSVAYDLTPAQWDDVRAYTAQLESKLVAVAGEALTRLRPARIRLRQGRSLVRRESPGDVQPAGPVDHGVPVLRVDGAGREPLAIVFGYSCHNTTLQDGFVQYHGDYAGVAQAALNCGIQVPRRSSWRAAGRTRTRNRAGPSSWWRRTGPRWRMPWITCCRRLCRSRTNSRRHTGPWRCRSRRSGPGAVARAAGHRAGVSPPPCCPDEAAIARDGRLPASQHDPVQVWAFGSDLTLIALGGEVVVDYARRLAREFPAAGCGSLATATTCSATYPRFGCCGKAATRAAMR